jgi:hypothetical protein
MRDISDTARMALESGRFEYRALVKLAPAGVAPFCIWDDRGDIVYGGDTYIGKAGRFALTGAGSSSDYSVRNLDITLASGDPDALAKIETTQWHQRPALVYRAIIAKDTPQILSVTPEFGGFMDTIEWPEAVGQPGAFIIHCESSSREYARTGARTASDADQRQRDAVDNFLSWQTSAVSTTIDWGRAPQAPPKQKQSSGFLSIFGL